LFAGRIAAQVTKTQLLPNAPGDGRGHGTFVAGLLRAAAPNSNIVSIDVMDDNGMALTSDVIAAADWILKNKAAYNIRVANLSLMSSVQSSFTNDPLDKAVERLWLNGVVVVAAAGNNGVEGQPSGVLYAPANDPFVITVGASDTHGTSSTNDDTAAPWSAYGYTPDGFLKPDLSAPGRHLVGPVPHGCTMAKQHPERLVDPSDMWMSGTSFATPIVAGAAADVLALHPTWTPDQVKGALMLTARVPRTKPGWSLGVGLLSANRAALVGSPPNPNLALDAFLMPDPNGPGSLFDVASWSEAARGNASWASASWSEASWASANWSVASWSEASWASASWSAASWAEASWAESAVPQTSWANNLWVD
jgi:serine protease AprX